MELIKDLRSYLRHHVLNFLSLFSRPAPYVQILNGHMINRWHENDDDGSKFAKQLEKLHEYCDFVNFETAVDLILNGREVNRSTIAFSFDDGFLDCYSQIFPQLKKYGVNAALFINPNYVDAGEKNDRLYMDHFSSITGSSGKQPMNWEQLKKLSEEGYVIGAHTLDHFCINDNNEQELKHQICDCKEVIEKRIGKKCEYFAYPYGRLEQANPKSIEIACSTYRYVFSQSDYKHFFSYNGRVINRRHFEPFWPVKHVYYFLSFARS